MKKIIRPQTEIDQQLFTPDYVPRPRNSNFDIPTTDILSTPTMCFRVNEQWVGHIIGALVALDQPDAWAGGIEEIDGARQQIRKLIGSIEECIMIEDCGDVADCIGNNADVINEISKTQAGVGSVVADRIIGNGVASGENCDNDIIFGGVTSLVEYLIEKATDALQIIEVATNFLDLLAEWGSSFPAISLLTAPLVGYLSWLQEAIAENFEAQVTTEYKDALRCELMCLWLEKCPDGMKWNDVAKYFIHRLGGTDDLLNDLFDLLSFMTLGFWDGDDIADVMMLAMIGIQMVEENPIPFINFSGLYTLDTVFALGANNPDADWMILCEECGDPVEFTYCWFADGNDPAWTGIIVGSGRQLPEYDATNEWFRALPITANTTGKEGRIEFVFSEIYSSIRVEAHVSAKNTRSSAGTTIMTIYTGTGAQQQGFGSNSVVTTHSVSGDHTMTDTNAVRILWRATTNTQGESEATSYARLDSIKLTVTAYDNPFPASNCP